MLLGWLVPPMNQVIWTVQNETFEFARFPKFEPSQKITDSTRGKCCIAAGAFLLRLFKSGLSMSLLFSTQLKLWSGRLLYLLPFDLTYLSRTQKHNSRWRYGAIHHINWDNNCWKYRKLNFIDKNESFLMKITIF